MMPHVLNNCCPWPIRRRDTAASDAASSWAAPLAGTSLSSLSSPSQLAAGLHASFELDELHTDASQPLRVQGSLAAPVGAQATHCADSDSEEVLDGHGGAREQLEEAASASMAPSWTPGGGVESLRLDERGAVSHGHMPPQCVPN